MRQGTNSRRLRNRNGRRQHSSSKQHTFDSSGPDVKVRGTASQVLEKYLTLARDATTSGDRVAAENFYQHAEHYYRILNFDGNSSGANGGGAPGPGPTVAAATAMPAGTRPWRPTVGLRIPMVSRLPTMARSDPRRRTGLRPRRETAIRKRPLRLSSPGSRSFRRCLRKIIRSGRPHPRRTWPFGSCVAAKSPYIDNKTM